MQITLREHSTKALLLHHRNYHNKHMPCNANGSFDPLYSLGHGFFTFYDPAKHGNWGVININGKPVVKLLDDVVDPDFQQVP